MLTIQNTTAPQSQQLPPAHLSWADWLAKLASLIESCNPTNDRVCFVASLVRDAADQAHLYSIDSPTAHYRWMCDECDDEGASGPDDDAAAPTDHGPITGHDAQYELYRAE